MNEERLRSPRPDVSDDSTHPELLSAAGPSGDVGRRFEVPKKRAKPGFRGPLRRRSVNRALVERGWKWYHRGPAPRRSPEPPRGHGQPAPSRKDERGFGP